MTWWKAVLGLAAMILGTASCSSDSNGQGGSKSCPPVDACGGDLSGSWRVTSFCTDLSTSKLPSTGLPAACDEAMRGAFSSANITPQDAAIEFAAGHYTQSGAMSIAITFTFDANCLKALGASPASPSVCSQIENGLSSQSTFSSPGCRFESGGCRCSVTLREPFDSTGPYTVQGNQVTLDADGQPSPFCVKGNTAALVARNNTAEGRLDLVR